MIEKIITIFTSSEASIRLTFTVLIFTICALWEIFAPKRKLPVNKGQRWFINLAITTGNSLLVRLIIPVIPYALALQLEQSGIGLFNRFQISHVPAFIAGIIILDFVIYMQHLMFHAVPLLWRLHMVHHADLGIDITTGLRFHPVEIVLSLFLKLGITYLFGIPPLAVLVFEILLNGMAMFNHGNIRLPLKLDAILRMLLVTPDMHRVHHSVTIRETNSNFGFNLAVWDRIFGTYRARPAAGHDEMRIGLAQYRDPHQVTLIKALLLPFNGNPGNYAINRWGRDPNK